MTSIWHSLIWKEWHEHKWKLVSMVAIMWGAAAFVFAFMKPEDVFAVAIGIIGMCILPLSMFIGLGVAASERSRNTLPFLQALPAPMWRVALVKLLLGLFSLLAAIALSIALVIGWRYITVLTGHDIGQALRFDVGPFTGLWYVDCFILLAPFAVGVFTWSAAAGVNRRDEISAGAMTVIAVVCWSLLLSLCYAVLAQWFVDFTHPYNRDKWAWLGVLAFSTLPGGTFPAGAISLDIKPPIPLALTCVTAAVTYSLLLASYVKRFGKLKNAEIRSRQSARPLSAQVEWLSAPRHSPTTATIWKQIFESGPIALTGIAVSAGVTLIAVLISIFDVQLSISEAIGHTYPFMSVFFGTLVALVAGIGVCYNDMTPKINEFWRSRPIQPDLWFWIKFVTGLLVVLASIYLPIGVLAAVRIPVFAGWHPANASYVPLMIQLAVFAAAVVTTCLVRQAVYAAILSIAVLYLSTLLGMAIYLLPAWLKGEDVNLLIDPPPQQLAFGLAVSFTISTLLAWLAVRHDWGKKSRY